MDDLVFHSSSASIDQIGARKHHYGCHNLLPGQPVHTQDDCRHHANQRLHVGVEAHHGGSQLFLSDGQQEIGDEGGKHDDVN